MRPFAFLAMQFAHCLQRCIDTCRQSIADRMSQRPHLASYPRDLVDTAPVNRRPCALPLRASERAYARALHFSRPRGGAVAAVVSRSACCAGDAFLK